MSSRNCKVILDFETDRVSFVPVGNTSITEPTTAKQENHKEQIQQIETGDEPQVKSHTTYERMQNLFKLQSTATAKQIESKEEEPKKVTHPENINQNEIQEEQKEVIHTEPIKQIKSHATASQKHNKLDKFLLNIQKKCQTGLKLLKQANLQARFRVVQAWKVQWLKKYY